MKIYVGLGKLTQRTVGVFLFLECRVEKLDGFVIAEFFGPAFQRAESRNLIMFHCLRGCEQASVEGGPRTDPGPSRAIFPLYAALGVSA